MLLKPTLLNQPSTSQVFSRNVDLRLRQKANYNKKLTVNAGIFAIIKTPIYAAYTVGVLGGLLNSISYAYRPDKPVKKTGEEEELSIKNIAIIISSVVSLFPIFNFVGWAGFAILSEDKNRQNFYWISLGLYFVPSFFEGFHFDLVTFVATLIAFGAVQIERLALTEPDELLAQLEDYSSITSAAKKIQE